MKLALIILLATLSSHVFSLDFPRSPNPQITPGSLCSHPDYYRYREKIPYCERDVPVQQKERIFMNYNKRLGFHMDPKRRYDFKVDHFIPLCAGGSNNDNNLWPQHYSIYKITDPLEGLGCEKLKLGLITHKNLVALIKQAKLNLNEAPRIMKYFESLK